jgi:hypothetical protein
MTRFGPAAELSGLAPDDLAQLYFGIDEGADASEPSNTHTAITDGSRQ